MCILCNSIKRNASVFSIDMVNGVLFVFSAQEGIVRSRARLFVLCATSTERNKSVFSKDKVNLYTLGKQGLP